MIISQKQQQSQITINGMVYQKQFITQQEEKQLIQNILQQQWNTSLKRRTQHYGFQYLYNQKNTYQIAPPIPQWAQKVKQKVELYVNELLNGKQQENSIKKQVKSLHRNISFDQLIINQYTPGQGINPHIDSPTLFQSPIVSISLGSDCIMEFDHEILLPSQTLEIPLQRRSIIVLDEQARYEWKHSIPPRKKDNGKPRTTRWSLTWRIMKTSINQK